ncbi:hypothetical protein A3A01_01195 [Candidatus Nomurabacteria bacterium RIFCSPLOWO2_01_FULL_39_17]|uniref:DUF4105 domain-containing protein n=1 Tax=Candidatus Nomurabacteria bacterium RIFCSPLOWO2_01_FULL_39_17 TaxID=1801770 RepID=A0A1F6WVI0_9BACT|nr:MAG: hypothetical protein A3A01_01195 [Candidatus Nomurabacteria bacterium RIFCSPLOWO2_01_FULL_39_17]
MNSQEFNSLIKKDKYQVFILYSSATFPFFVVHHPWFVINRKGIISRWDVLHREYFGENSWGHLHKDFFLPWQGIEMFLSVPIFRWKSNILNIIEGDENSPAAKMADFIEHSPQNYIYTQRYSFIGPNCSTYVEWVLDKFPEAKIKLPWNAIGKNFRE